MNAVKTTPIVGPLVAILRSRKFIVSVITFIVGVITLQIPELQAVRGELTAILITVALAFITGTAVEDAAAVGRAEAAKPVKALADAARDVGQAIVDEAFGPPTPANTAPATPEQLRQLSDPERQQFLALMHKMNQTGD